MQPRVDALEPSNTDEYYARVRRLNPPRSAFYMQLVHTTVLNFYENPDEDDIEAPDVSTLLSILIQAELYIPEVRLKPEDELFAEISLLMEGERMTELVEYIRYYCESSTEQKELLKRALARTPKAGPLESNIVNIASYNNCRELIDLLRANELVDNDQYKLPNNNKFTPLFGAVTANFYSFASWRLESGDDPNAITACNTSLLAAACTTGSLEMVTLLLAHRAKPVATEALIEALLCETENKAEQIKIVRMIIQRGLNVLTRINGEKTVNEYIDEFVTTEKSDINADAVRLLKLEIAARNRLNSLVPFMFGTARKPGSTSSFARLPTEIIKYIADIARHKC